MFKPFNPFGYVKTTAANLPHWSQRGATYFVTFRLNDSLPQKRLALLRTDQEAWIQAHPRPWSRETQAEFNACYEGAVQAWLDAGAGSCLLGDPRRRDLVERTLRHSAGQQYQLDDLVVAENHVHVLVEPVGGSKLSTIVQAWKSCSARLIGCGPIWQKESYDHLVRNVTDLERIRRYIQGHREWRR